MISIIKTLTGIVGFVKKNYIMALVIVSIALTCAGVFLYQKNKISRLEKENTELNKDYLSIKSELIKKKSDHEFDFIPPSKKDLKEALDKNEKSYLKNSHLKIKDVQSHSKIEYGIDTVYLPSKVESVKVNDSIPTDHVIDFSNTNITSIVTFKSLNDSVFDPKQQLKLEDSLRYTTYQSKEKVGTKRFLFIFKIPKYQKVTRVKVTNTNPEVKLKNVEIVVAN